MFEFPHWPWLLLLPLPFLIRWLVPAKQQQESALKLPGHAELYQQSATVERSENNNYLGLVGLWGIWLLLLIAAANPTWTGDPVTLPASGRDLMMAVDTSGSMKAEDMTLNSRQVNRLHAVKEIAGDFLERRSSDRVGLILFGGNAYLQAPLTFDRDTVGALLQDSFLGIAGADGTAIGDAIGLAIKRLKTRPESSRVLILLTDGANNAGNVTPLKAAELAAQEHIKIYTIGIGADRMVVPGFFGQRTINPSADLDETTLQTIADTTGGRYFRARNADELEAIYATLDELEPVEQDAETFRPSKTLFYWPLAMAFMLSLLWAGIRFIRRWI